MPPWVEVPAAVTGSLGINSGKLPSVFYRLVMVCAPPHTHTQTRVHKINGIFLQSCSHYRILRTGSGMQRRIEKAAATEEHQTFKRVPKVLTRGAQSQCSSVGKQGLTGSVWVTDTTFVGQLMPSFQE